MGNQLGNSGQEDGVLQNRCLPEIFPDFLYICSLLGQPNVGVGTYRSENRQQSQVQWG